MSIEPVLEQVAAATVRLPRGEGLGVIISPEIVLTAAHLVRWTPTGAMALASEEFLEGVFLATGDSVIAQVLAIEPVSDVAVLGCPDSQMILEDDDGGVMVPAEEFEDLLSGVAPARLFVDEFPSGEIPVHIRTHRDTWIDATAEQHRADTHFIRIRSPHRIEGGTSGGPVVLEDGRVIGVISNASGSPSGSEGWVAQPHLALPSWVVRQLGAS